MHRKFSQLIPEWPKNLTGTMFLLNLGNSFRGIGAHGPKLVDPFQGISGTIQIEVQDQNGA